ncbi:squalene/phytoene synthase family protein [Bradyrhizobium guangdongense]|uniref:squalene/phytoene synthase family protein n=1 Tax=Bradyrhizobium guangdongense TaxID=1325090 RepID=UPI001642EC7E|nr:squalene/phytoene synthase family protein [Bradyrhizobium guangdongense]
MDVSIQAQFSVQSAQAAIRRSSHFTYLLSLLLPAADRPYFWAWYVYVRWLDDIADDVSLASATRYDFLTRQIQLVHDLYSGRRVNLSKDEAPLDALVAYDIGRDALLKDSLSMMLSAMQFDVQRHGTISEYQELRRNFDYEVSNCLLAIGYFCRIPGLPAKIPGRAAANGAKVAHVLRDFLRDCDEGIYNISREELDAYGMALPTLTADIATPTGRRWVASNVRLAERHLMSGLQEASTTPGLRYPLIVAILVAKYQAYLDRFRANDYVMQRQASIGFGFAKNLLANLGTLLLHRPRAAVRRSIGADTPKALAQRSAPAWAGLLARLLPIFNRPVVAAIDQALRDVSIPDDKRRKLRRRFATAYWIGRNSYASIDTRRDEGHAGRGHSAGLVYAFWSIAAIELDRLIDDRALAPERALALIDEWLGKAAKAISGVSIDQTCRRTEIPTSSDDQNDSFQRLTSAFQHSLSRYCDLAVDIDSRRSIADTFLGEARAVLMAQFNSREQKILDPGHDWHWYMTQLLNQKTLGFAFAPWALWVRDDTTSERRRNLEDDCLTLIAGYWHWQILDDVADIRGDTRQGLVTTPGFILLSQGALARSYLDCVSTTTRENAAESATTSPPVAAILATELVSERFLASPLADDFRHLISLSHPADTPAARESMLRCALVNGDDDVSADLICIARARRDQAASYVDAMRSGDWSAALNVLGQSRVMGRILVTVDQDVGQSEARERLALIRAPSSRAVLGIVEMLIRHCYRKARRASLEV